MRNRATFPRDEPTITVGDRGFVGVNARLEPHLLPPGYVSEAINMRFNRGVAETRLGFVKLPWCNKITTETAGTPTTLAVPFAYYKLDDAVGSALFVDATSGVRHLSLFQPSGGTFIVQKGVASGRANTGTAVTTTMSSSATSGGYFRANDTSLRMSSQSFSVSGWGRINSGGAGANTSGIYYLLTMLDPNTAATTGGYALKFAYSSGWKAIFETHTASAATQAVSTTAIAEGTWYNLVGTYDRTAAQMKLYVNATLEATTSSVPAMTDSSHALRALASQRQSNSNSMPASWDELGIWTGVLTQTQVNTIYNSGNGNTYP